jgi:hypothetical protein
MHADTHSRRHRTIDSSCLAMRRTLSLLSISRADSLAASASAVALASFTSTTTAPAERAEARGPSSEPANTTITSVGSNVSVTIASMLVEQRARRART